MSIAIIYIRFSTLEQRGGSSITRQRADCLAMCQRHNWTAEAELIDEGKSAFTGKNLTESACLGRFLREADEGLHIGKTLVVERLDRLSRADPTEGFDLLRRLTQAGVSVATVDSDECYEADKPLNFSQIIMMFTKYYVANEESAKKAERVSEGKAHAVRRAREEGRTISKTTPPWIVTTKWERKTIEVIAEVVRMIFRWVDEGVGGRTQIVRRLHREGIAPISNRASQGWHESYITRLLSNRAVLGEYTPKNGEPIPNYYPAIVDAALFARVNADAPARKVQMGGRQDTRLSNLFSGLVQCPKCGGPSRFRTRKKEGSVRIVNGKEYRRTRPDAYLICSNAERGGGCDNDARVAYACLETGLLDALLHLALDDEVFSNRGEIGRVANLIAERERDLELAEGRAEKLWSAWAEDGSPMAKKLAQEAEQKAGAFSANIEGLKKQLGEARGRADNAAHLRRVGDIRAKLYDPDLEVRVPLRRKVMQALPTLIEKLECDQGGTSVHLNRGAGLLLFGRKGNLRMGVDLVHEKRKQPPELADYLRRRAEAKKQGDIFAQRTAS